MLVTSERKARNPTSRHSFILFLDEFATHNILVRAASIKINQRDMDSAIEKYYFGKLGKENVWICDDSLLFWPHVCC